MMESYHRGQRLTRRKSTFIFVCLVFFVILSYAIHHSKLSKVLSQKIGLIQSDHSWINDGVQIVPIPYITDSLMKRINLLIPKSILGNITATPSHVLQLLSLARKQIVPMKELLTDVDETLLSTIPYVNGSDFDRSTLSLGSMPAEIIQSLDLKKDYNSLNPPYKISPVYYIDNVSTQDDNHCSVTALERRISLFRSLQQWIRFAYDHKIVWWITAGTLLGSFRDGQIIPYDTDMDIGILLSDEQKIRNLATKRKNIKIDHFNFVVRPGAGCLLRMNCKGEYVRVMTDMCAFCGPIARIFHHFSRYVDIFPMQLELWLNKTSKYPLAFGMYREKMGKYRLHDLSLIFPLRTCIMMGLKVPCPNKPEELLKIYYGEYFKIPRRRCHPKEGKWVEI